MSIDVSAAYGEGIILTREEYLELEDFLFENNENNYWRFVYRINCYTDDTEYFFGKVLQYAECGLTETIENLEMTDKDFADITRGIREINKKLGTVKSKEKYLLSFLG
jgi:hypothetical protein